MIEVTPFGDRIFVKLEPKESVVGPLALPENAAQRSWPAVVLGVGEDCKYFKAGDQVLISVYTGIPVQIYENRWLQNDYRMLTESEVLGRWKRS